MRSIAKSFNQAQISRKKPAKGGSFQRKRHPLFLADPLQKVWRFPVANLDTPYAFLTLCWGAFWHWEFFPETMSSPSFREADLGANAMMLAVQ